MKLVIPIWWSGDVDAFFMDNPIDQVARVSSAWKEKPEIVCPILRFPDSRAHELIFRLKESGVTVVDAEAETQKFEKSHQTLVNAYSTFGSIKHYCLARFAVLDEIFGGESICFLDADVIPVTDPVDFVSLLGQYYFVEKCPCFGFISRRSDFYEVYADAVGRVNRLDEAWIKTLYGVSLVKDAFDPTRVNGSDQAVISGLFRLGILDQVSPTVFYENGIFPFSSLLPFEPHNFTYYRKGGADYINDLKVMIHHFNNDFCTYLKCFEVYERFTGSPFDAGRMPNPIKFYGDKVDAKTDSYMNIIYHADELFRRGGTAEPSSNHWSRAYLVKKYLLEKDFRDVFRCWWKPGVFRTSN